jgi:putative SOS response-associated peptidase YedK
MCGRFALISSKDTIKAQFAVIDSPDFESHYNIAPSLPVLSIVEIDHHNHAVLFKWGLIPYWAKDKKIGNSLTNARAETVNAKPAFRTSLKSKRCLMVMSGFFEWQEQGGIRQPYYIKRKDDGLLAIAALWESWQSPDGSETIQSCCLITTEANALLDSVHHRMPVVLDSPAQALWLNPNTSVNEALHLLRPYEGTELELFPVSTKVNSSRYLGRDTIKPL